MGTTVGRAGRFGILGNLLLLLCLAIAVDLQGVTGQEKESENAKNLEALGGEDSRSGQQLLEDLENESQDARQYIPPPSAGAVASIIPQQELHAAGLFDGGQNTISCQKMGDMYYYSTAVVRCLICVCLPQYDVLTPICAACEACIAWTNSPVVQPTRPPWYPTTPPGPTRSPWYPTTTAGPTLPPWYPTTPAGPTRPPWLPTTSPPGLPTPPPWQQSTLAPVDNCEPLPTNVPFQNPLNPCQVCICSHLQSPLGQNELNIVCQEDAGCVVPSNNTNITPPPTNNNVPVQWEYCGYLPPQVWFPHPREPCSNCICFLDHIRGPLVQCYVNPQCVIQPTTLIPWNDTTLAPPHPTTVLPPVTTVKPKPNPLPGPGPHKSCYPYQPDVPFDHPWDACLLCQCSQSAAQGQTEVSLFCYTKLECCIIPANDAVGGASEIIIGPNIASQGQPYLFVKNPNNAHLSILGASSQGGNLAVSSGNWVNGGSQQYYGSKGGSQQYFGSKGGSQQHFGSKGRSQQYFRPQAGNQYIKPKRVEDSILYQQQHSGPNLISSLANQQGFRPPALPNRVEDAAIYQQQKSAANLMNSQANQESFGPPIQLPNRLDDALLYQQQQVQVNRESQEPGNIEFYQSHKDDGRQQSQRSRSRSETNISRKLQHKIANLFRISRNGAPDDERR